MAGRPHDGGNHKVVIRYGSRVRLAWVASSEGSKFLPLTIGHTPTMKAAIGQVLRMVANYEALVVFNIGLSKQYTPYVESETLDRTAAMGTRGNFTQFFSKRSLGDHIALGLRRNRNLVMGGQPVSLSICTWRLFSTTLILIQDVSEPFASDGH